MVLAGWGQFPVQEGALCAPSQWVGLEAALRGPYAPRGLGRSYGDASLPAPGHLSVGSVYWDHFLALDTEKGTVTVEAGVSLESMLQALLPKGFFLPVTPGTRHVTVGGAIASNVHGKNHHRRGSIERFVTHLVVETPVGKRRCDREQDAELFHTTLGGYGLTGFITEVGLKLLRVSTGGILQRTHKARNLSQLLQFFLDSKCDAEYSVAWCDTLAQGHHLGRGVLYCGEHADAKATAGLAIPRLTDAAKSKSVFEIPFNLPSRLLHPSALTAFNAAYFYAQREGEKCIPLQSFFYPLDQFAHWNRLYGRLGFLQYQCVIPDPQGAEGIEAVLKFLTQHHLGSFLAVLKRCDDDFSGLPFCKRGFTLALDLPLRDRTLPRRLDTVDEIVLRFGGRVYLTKDARLRPDLFRAMYPEWKSFMGAVKKVNPVGQCNTAMAERLQLWGDAA